MLKPKHLSAVMAVAANGVIGLDGGMPWHHPEDLANFKKITLNSPVIMGRGTFESLNFILPNRLNIIVSKSNESVVPLPAVKVPSIQTALALVSNWSKAFIIGGANLLDQMSFDLDSLHLTLIKEFPEGDTYLPELGLKLADLNLSLEPGTSVSPSWKLQECYGLNDNCEYYHLIKVRI